MKKLVCVLTLSLALGLSVGTTLMAPEGASLVAAASGDETPGDAGSTGSGDETPGDAGTTGTGNSGEAVTPTTMAAKVETGTKEVTADNGAKVEVSIETVAEKDVNTVKSFYNAPAAQQKTKVEAYIKSAGSTYKLPENQEIKSVNVLAAVEINATIPAGAKSVIVPIPVQGLNKDKNYVVLHLKDDGTWEALAATVDGDALNVEFTSFSPVVIAEVELQKAGTDDGDDGDSDSEDSQNPASPKTGETLPLAGGMAVICLAGAYVCAKRVKTNR